MTAPALDIPRPPALPAPDPKDSTMTSDDATTPNTTAPTSTPGAACPIRVGDEVVFARRRDLRAEVTGVFSDDGLLEYSVRTASDERAFVRPWDLLPADPGLDTPEWRQRMQRFRDSQREDVRARIRQRQNEITDRLTAFAERIETIAHAVFTGEIPDTTAVDSAPLRTEFTARDLDEDLRRLAEFRETVLEAGLFTPDEL
ncbi:hypothetical protein ACFYTQ_28130 [Nocardia sp. NPDC004068]|uniref:hypothetical protein n=1 Tax=Nocardia sp. NPDC004068 TaxID=3364303 RepID=UPI00367F6A04